MTTIDLSIKGHGDIKNENVFLINNRDVWFLFGLNEATLCRFSAFMVLDLCRKKHIVHLFIEVISNKNFYKLFIWLFELSSRLRKRLLHNMIMLG
jgi:hypothetical protein